MQRCRPILALACTISSIAYLKNDNCLEKGEDTSFRDKKGKGKYEELPLSNILYSNYLTNNQVKRV